MSTNPLLAHLGRMACLATLGLSTLLVAAGCSGDPVGSDGPTTDDLDDGGGPDDGSAADLGAPASDCETRQIDAEGAVAGPADVQTTCSEERVVSLHRPGGVACTTESPPLDPCLDPGGECMTDQDCVAIVGAGQCASFDGLGGACLCVRDCVSDADCPDDRACICRAGVVFDGVPRTLVAQTGCWPAECRTDDDCGGGAECALVNPEATCVTAPSLACRDASDGCQSDLDCAQGEACERNAAADAWQCGMNVCQ